MPDSLSSDTVVIGVGNTILSDDGIGVHAARLLQRDPRVPAGVTILDGGTLGLGLVSYASDVSHVLLLDAVDSRQAPGLLTRMTARDLLGTTRGWSAHQLGVADLISALALISKKPQDIIVLGVQPKTTEWGTSLSSEAEAALVPLVDAAVEELRRWAELTDAPLKVHPSSPIAVSSRRTPAELAVEGDERCVLPFPGR